MEGNWIPVHKGITRRANKHSAWLGKGILFAPFSP